ncbi:MAG: RNA polymerase sigma factor [Planctomycetota bacterium]
MMREQEIDCLAVLETAQRWLRLRPDSFTRSQREDLEQETALAVWTVREKLGMADRPHAYGTTIARHVRFHGLRRYHSQRTVSLDEEDFDSEAIPHPVREAHVRIDCGWVDRDWLLRALDRALVSLDPINRRLLEEHYSGTNCRDLGERFGLSVECVKQRLFRSRARLRDQIVAGARCAGYLDEPKKEENDR